MRLGGRARAAAEILADIEARKRPATDALKDWGLNHRFAGSGDRSAIGNLVFDTLRRKASQAWRMGSDGPDALVFATLLDQWNYQEAQLAAEFAGDTHAPEPLPAETIARWRQSKLEEAPAAIRADVPDWTAPLFEAAFGPAWVAEAAALALRPPLDLRVNALKANRDKVAARLARLGAKLAANAPFGLRIAPPGRDGRLPNVTAETGFAKGWFEIQDEGSQLAAALADARPGEQVLDWCAGGGGKSLAIAAAMANKGQVHAHDKDRARLAEIHARLRRAGTRNVQVHEPEAGGLKALEARMDCVLVDAPCSGSGTWRRRHDAKWRLTPAALAMRQGEQDAALGEAANFVRPGGRLVYVTCSMFAAENCDRVAAFLARRPDFAARLLEPALSGLCSPSQRHDVGPGMVAFTPKMTATDGFFVAVMEKRV